MRELKALAEFKGFAGNAKQWRTKWFDLCAYLGCSPQHGMDSLVFAFLVNDRSDQGYFCTNAELRNLRYHAIDVVVNGKQTRPASWR